MLHTLLCLRDTPVWLPQAVPRWPGLLGAVYARPPPHALEGFLAGWQRCLSALTAVGRIAQGPERTFYSQNYKVRMSVYETRPLMFDLIMSAGVAAYLFTMLVAMLGPGEAVKALVELTKSNAKKAKSR